VPEILSFGMAKPGLPYPRVMLLRHEDIYMDKEAYLLTIMIIHTLGKHIEYSASTLESIVPW